jgi:PAS domain-containing protein
MGTRAEPAPRRHTQTNHAGAVRRAATPIEEFLASSDPVWVWDGENRRIAWANAAGAAFWGEKNFESLRVRQFDGAVQGVARMDALSRSQSSEMQWVEELAFPSAQGNKNLLCCMQRLQLAGGEWGVIVRALGGRAKRAWSGAACGNGADRQTPDRQKSGGRAVRPSFRAPRLLKAAADALGGYLSLNAAGEVVFASKNVGRLLGRECAQLIGLPFARLFSGDRKRIARIERIIRIAKRPASNTLARFDAALLGSAGALIPCRVLIMPVREGEGASVALCDLRQTKALKRSFKARRKRGVMRGVMRGVTKKNPGEKVVDN